jgi:hypothetical protein
VLLDVEHDVESNPELPSVELMSDGKTDEAIIDVLMRRLPQ